MLTAATPVRLGPVSTGTLDATDLINAYIRALDDIREKLASPGSALESGESTLSRTAQVARLDDILANIERFMDHVTDEEELDYALRTLTGLLEDFAPPYCRFGPSSTDPTAIGYWPDEDALAEAIAEGRVIALNTGDEWPEDELHERPGVEGVYYYCFPLGRGNLYAPLALDPFRELWRW